jgi:hypothetical protein
MSRSPFLDNLIAGKLKEEFERMQLQAEQLAHLEDRLERITEAIALANRLGFERRTSEHIEGLSLMLKLYGVEPDIIAELEALLKKPNKEKFNHGPQQGPEIQESQQ